MPLTNKKFKVSSSLDSLLIKYDKLGIIPGPAEMEPEFLKRAENCLGLRKRIESELGTTIPLRQEELAPAEVFERPLDKTEALWVFDLIGCRYFSVIIVCCRGMGDVPGSFN